MRPGVITRPVLRCTLPAAAVRLITRPAPWTVENSASRCRVAVSSSAAAAPWTMTASSPMDPPMKPFCPGNAGVAPLRTTTYSRSSPCGDACVSFQAKLWWLCTSSSSVPPSSETTLRATHSRPAYA
jgi:hypothetical protein